MYFVEREPNQLSISTYKILLQKNNSEEGASSFMGAYGKSSSNDIEADVHEEKVNLTARNVQIMKFQPINDVMDMMLKSIFDIGVPDNSEFLSTFIFFYFGLLI